METVRITCNKLRTAAATALKRFNIRVAKSCGGGFGCNGHRRVQSYAFTVPYKVGILLNLSYIF